MQVKITAATLEDAAAIASLKAHVWPTEPAVLGQIEQALVHKDHVTQVARAADGGVIGFVDGFLTQANTGQPRWEVDLLAVDPAYHGHRIGQQLVAASILAGRTAGAALSRALIQTENFASQGAFRHSGFRTTGQTYRLMVADAAATTATATVEPYLVPVCTLNYSGLWLEGEQNAAYLAAAVGECARQHSGIVGVLLPVQATDLLIAARQLGYQTVEHFQWWSLAFA